MVMEYTDFTCRQVGDTDEQYRLGFLGHCHIELGERWVVHKFGNPRPKEDARVRSCK